MMRGLPTFLLILAAAPYAAGALRHQLPARRSRAAIIAMEAQDSAPPLEPSADTESPQESSSPTPLSEHPNISVRLMEENRQRMLLEGLEGVNKPTGQGERRFDPLSSPNVASFFTQQTPQTIAWPLAFIVILLIQPWGEIWG